MNRNECGCGLLVVGERVALPQHKPYCFERLVVVARALPKPYWLERLVVARALPKPSFDRYRNVHVEPVLVGLGTALESHVE